MKVNTSNLAFSGHSLGGAISQAQVVYFEDIRDKEYSISMSRNFEPFGIGRILSELGKQNVEAMQMQKEQLKHPTFMSPMQMDALALNAGNIGRSTTAVNMALRKAYKGLPMNYMNKLVNYYRVGDSVAEQELDQILGRVVKLETNYTKLSSYAHGVNERKKEHPIDIYTIDPQAELTNQAMAGVGQIATDKFYNLHTMTNYRYQGSQEQNGSLLEAVNDANVKILKEHSDKVTKTRYDLVFNAMKGFEEI